MNFFGMGTMEVVVILVVALMIFGPGKLPEVAGQAGKMLRDFKKMTTDLSDEFEKTSGINDIKKQVQKEMAGIQKEVGGVTSGVKKELTSASSTVNSATGKKPAGNKSLPSKPAGAVAKSTTTTSGGLKTTTNAAGTKTTTAAKTSTTAKAATPAKVAPPKATKADPLADVSFMDDIFAEPVSVTKSTAVSPAKPVAATTASPAKAMPVAKPATPSLSADPPAETGDALARSRARRQQAGYTRVQA
jgi:Tat protein translocase TatB subunit